MASGSRREPGDVQGRTSSPHSRTRCMEALGRRRAEPGPALGLRALGRPLGVTPGGSGKGGMVPDISRGQRSGKSTR